MTPRSIWRMIQTPYEVLTEATKRYGPVFTLRLTEGVMVFAAHPDQVRTILSAPPDSFAAFGEELLAPFLGEQSMLLLAGEAHKAERKLLMPPFHGSRMRAYGEVMREVARKHIARVAGDAPFDVHAITQEISLEVIIRAVFGVAGEQDVDSTRHEILATIDGMHPLLVFLPFLRQELMGVGPWAKFVRQRQKLKDRLDLEIDRRLETGERGEDILSLMLDARYDDGAGMSREKLHAELFTLLAAGHETTGVSLAWALYWLHRQPEQLERICAELDSLGSDPSLEALVKLPYLGAVCDEALRIFPVVPLVARRLRVPFRLGEYDLPAGIAVAAAIGALHRSEEIYPEPLEFRPERFLERQFTPFEYLPFGGGARRCLGAAFALYEMKIVLGTLLGEHRLALRDQAPPRLRRRNLTMGPANGVWMSWLGARD